MSEAIVVLGASGHAKVCVEVLRAQRRYEPRACLDPSGPPSVLGVPRLGGDEHLASLRAEGVAHAFVAVGANAARERLCLQLKEQGFSLPAAIDPSARISPTAKVDEGVLIMPNCVINADSRIGAFAIVNTAVVVEHDCDVGQAAHLGPGTVLTGHVTVGARAFLGARCVARPGVKIGEDVQFGAGSVIVDDHLEVGLYVGAPARRLNSSTPGV